MKTILFKLVLKLPNSHVLISGGKCSFIDYTIPYSFNGWFSIIMWLNSFGKRQWIVSTYNSYENINTYNGFFGFVFSWECKLNKVEHTVERYVKGSDQITYHSPYNNFY